jgi:hypothetical protein
MANSMIIHGKNQKIRCFYIQTTQISVKNGQNGLPSMGCRAKFKKKMGNSEMIRKE